MKKMDDYVAVDTSTANTLQMLSTSYIATVEDALVKKFGEDYYAVERINEFSEADKALYEKLQVINDKMKALKDALDSSLAANADTPVSLYKPVYADYRFAREALSDLVRDKVI